MAEIERDANQLFRRPFRRMFASLTFFFLVALFFFWRIESERVETLRAKIIDLLAPTIEFGIKPGEFFFNLAERVQNIVSADERIKQLEDEVKSLKIWRSYAKELEQENASLRNIAKVGSQAHELSFTAEVFADTSNHFAQTVLIDAGTENGISDGWPATDGLGLVGRISGAGDSVSRIILLTDPNSRIPVRVDRSGSRAILVGDNSSAPLIRRVQGVENIRLGDRVVTSGDGGVFPRGLLVGNIVQDGRFLRVNLAANYRKLEYVAILQTDLPEPITTGGGLIVAESLGLDETISN